MQVFDAVNRIEQVPFAQIANAALRDERLSFRARGILAMVLSHTDGWKATRDWIVTQSEKEGRDAIQRALNELTALGYREVRKVRLEDGTIRTEVHWRHVPLEAHAPDREGEVGAAPSESRETGNPPAGTPGLLSEHYYRTPYKEDGVSPVGSTPSPIADAPDEERGAELALIDPAADAVPAAKRGKQSGEENDAEAQWLAEQFAESLDQLEVKHRYWASASTRKTWQRDMRLMRDRDGRTPDEILGALQWAHNDGFWRANILSPGKLRAKYEQMRLRAMAENGRQRDPVERKAQQIADLMAWAHEQDALERGEAQ